MMYSATVIVSFHPVFITKVDKAYKIECFYGETDSQLDAQLNVRCAAYFHEWTRISDSLVEPLVRIRFPENSRIRVRKIYC